MSYLQFDIVLTDRALSDQLVALLSEAGFDGFEETESSLKAFIPQQAFREELLNPIKHLYPGIVFTPVLVETINWNAKWESDYEPVIVSDFAAVRATFHPPITNVQHEIIITPKMSFGTGHHATTFMMMESMGQLDLARKTVLDFGTGTGVLAILAEKCGASVILGIDNDEWSITNAKENIGLNHCSRVNIQEASQVPSGEAYDIILANINFNIIRDNLPGLSRLSKTGTQVLLSGFLAIDESAMTEMTSTQGFRSVKTRQKGDWICLHLVKN